jgi:predicted ATPase
VYEEWLEAPRERLRKQQLQNLLTLSNRYLQTDPKRALNYAESALAIDPWDEDAVRCVLSARTNLGDRVGAIHVYSKFAQRLREEFGTEPTAETQQAFQAAKIAESRNNNLPLQLTSFVGREHVLAEIEPMIEKSRLVTLVGTGGVGKTRCAVQVGLELVDGSADGVWLAELAPISDPSLVGSVIARALSLQESPNRPILDTLVAYLKRKRLLLILDNCEHVLEQARHVAGAIVRDCADVRILATSREPLNISGEETYRMPSLAIPPSAELLFTESVPRYGAVQLFVDRAVSSDKRFILTEENAPHVTEICRRLDGIPLAIELAAARAKVLSPQQLARKMDERFRVLTGGDRSKLPRHQTMRALIDWSYDLLSNDERALFPKLSIFAGGFTLEAATAVCSEERDEIVVLDLLSSLVDKSLVQAEPVGGGTRYRLLESTRQYGREKLSDAGEDDALAIAHARVFLSLAEQLDDAWETTPDSAWLAKAEPELENFRAALSWAFGARGEVLLGQCLAGISRRVWAYFGAAEGRRWVQAAQERTAGDTPAAVLAALDLAEAQLAARLYEYKASLAAGERALARYRELADPRRVAVAESRVGWALLYLSRVAEGEPLLRHALEEAQVLGMRKNAAYALWGLADGRRVAGDVAGARQRFGEALAAARAAGTERLAANIATNLAETEFRGGDVVMALRLVDEALPVIRALRETIGLANANSNMAAYLTASRRYDGALVSAREALAAARDAEFSVAAAAALQHLAAIGALRRSADSQLLEDRRRAARILGYVDARFEALGFPREYTEQQEYDTMLPALRDALGADECAKLMNEGSTWSEDQAIAEAMLI